MSESDYLTATRTAYDAVAVEYADTFRDALDDRPLNRAMISAFAELVRSAGPARAADIGCGPGPITAYLRELGVDVFGVDLSPEMLAIARKEHPGLRFTEGSMTALDIADGSLGGVLSNYSVIHVPPADLPAVFAQFHRVLAPGGYLYLGFFANTDASRLAWPFDHKVAPAYRLSIDRVADLLQEAGFTETARLIEAPPPDSLRGFESATLLHRKPAA